jgi:hypothetical protein
MSTEIIVALVGFGSAALGVLAAYLGRTKVQIHRHETVSSPQPAPTAPQGLGLLQKFGIAMIVIGVLGGSGWFVYSTYSYESRALDTWEQYRAKNGLPGNRETANTNNGMPITEFHLGKRKFEYTLSMYRYRVPDGECGYTIMRFDWPWDAMNYVKEHPDLNHPLVRNSGLVLSSWTTNPKAEDNAAWEQVQSAFKAFP